MRRLFWFPTLGLLGALGACDGGSDSPETEITITTLTPPQLLVVRDDADGRWVPLTGETPTSFRYVASGPYRVTAGCDEGDGLVTLWQVARTPEDGPELAIPCGTPPRTARVATTMVQPGMVSLDDSITLSNTSSWDVILDTAPGTKTLVATSDAHVAIRRDLAITGPTTLPALDVAAEGIAYVPAPITVENAAADEDLRATVNILVDDAFGRVYRGAPADAKVVPGGALGEDARQTLRVTASRGDASRFATKVGADPVVLTLPPPLADATFAVTGDDASATWAGDVAGTVNFSVFANNADFSLQWFHSLDVSESYAATLDRTVTLELADIANVPSELRFDYATAEHDRALTIFSETATESQGVTVRKFFNSPEPESVRPANASRGRGRIEERLGREGLRLPK